MRRRITALLLASLAFLVVGAVALLVDGNSLTSLLLVGTGSVGVVLGVQVVLHEAGHALAARLLGFTVHQIVLGEGPVVARGRLGSVAVELRLIPIGGCAVATTGSSRAFRTRSWAYIAAGPIVTALVGWSALRWQTEPGSLGQVARAALTASSFLLLVPNVVPWRGVADGRVIASDGWWLVNLPLLSGEEIEAQVAEHRRVARYGRVTEGSEQVVRKVREELASPDADPLQTRVDLVNLLVAEHRWGEILEAGRWLVDHVDRADPGRPDLLNVLAWSALCLDDPTLLEEADRWSAEALELRPAEPAVLNTRGGVLVVRGEVDDGLDLVRRSAVAGLGRTERGATAALLAIGEAKRRNLFDARRHLVAATKLDPRGDLLPQARRAVDELAVTFDAPSNRDG